MLITKMRKRIAKSLMTPDFIKGFLVGIIIAFVFWYLFSSVYGPSL